MLTVYPAPTSELVAVAQSASGIEWARRIMTEPPNNVAIGGLYRRVPTSPPERATCSAATQLVAAIAAKLMGLSG